MNLFYFNIDGNDEVYSTAPTQVESYEDAHHPISIWKSRNDPTPNYLIQKQASKAEPAAIKHL